MFANIMNLRYLTSGLNMIGICLQSSVKPCLVVHSLYAAGMPLKKECYVLWHEAYIKVNTAFLKHIQL